MAFSKTTISQITFTRCTFEDCLFIGTQFNEVEFHGCSFLNCNFWKAHLRKVYLRPDTIKFDDRFRVEAANVGISLYQALLANFAEERQDHFFMQADIAFRRWKRFQIGHDLRRKNISHLEAGLSWVSSAFYDFIAGFGYRPIRFFFFTIGLFLLISCVNYHVIGDEVSIDGVTGPQASFANTIFYTFSILTVLGFSSVVPVTDGAKILTVLEALASIGWLGIFSAVLVKRFLR